MTGARVLKWSAHSGWVGLAEQSRGDRLLVRKAVCGDNWSSRVMRR